MKRISRLVAFFISLCALHAVSAFAPIARFLDDNPEGIPGEDYPVFRSVPRGLHFGCNDKKPGFYADPETRCQVWHLCDTFGRRHSFICPNQTVFNQLIRGCDWWYNVDCDNARDLYWNNDELFRENPDNRLGFQGRRAGGTASRGEQNSIASDVDSGDQGGNSVNPFSVSVSSVQPVNQFSVSTEPSFVRRPSTIPDQGRQDFNNGIRQPQQVKVVRRPVVSTPRPAPETFPPETFVPQTSTLPPFPTRNFNRNRFFTNPPVTTTPPPTTANAFLPWSSTPDPFAFDPPIDTFAPDQNLNDPSSDDGPPTSWTVRFIAGNVNPSTSSPFSFEPLRENRAQNFGQEGDSNADNAWSWRLAQNQDRAFAASTGNTDSPVNDAAFPTWPTAQSNSFQGFSSTPRSAHNFDETNNNNNNNNNNNFNNNNNNIHKNTNSQNNVHPPAFQNTLRPIVNSHNNNFAPAFQSNPRPVVNSHNNNFAPAFQSTTRPKFTTQDRNNNNNNNFPPAFQSTPRPFINTQPHESFSPAFQSTPQPKAPFASTPRNFGNTDTDDNIGSFSSTSGDFVDNNEVTTFGSTRRSFQRISDSFDSSQFLQSSTPFSVSTSNHLQDSSIRSGSAGFSRVPFVPSSTVFPIRSTSQKVPDWLTSSLPDDNSLSHVPTLTVDFSPDFEDTTNFPGFTTDVPRSQSTTVPFKITTYHPRARFNDVTTTFAPTLPPTTTTTTTIPPRRRRPTHTTTTPPPTEPETTPTPTTTTPEPGVPLAYGARIQPRPMVRASVINDNSVAGSSVHETSVIAESKPVAKSVSGGYDLIPLADGSPRGESQ